MASKNATAPVTEGEIWSIPVDGVGHFPLVVARAPSKSRETPFVFAYVGTEASGTPVTPSDIKPLGEWGKAWLGLLPLQPFAKARWQRCGVVPQFERNEWPVPPQRSSDVDEQHEPGELSSLWSIETTADEPTMTLLANEAVAPEVAKGFPARGVFTAASSFEKALTRFAKGRKGGFGDVDVLVEPIDGEAIVRWRNHAEHVRRTAPPNPNWLPAGKATDRAVRAGHWLALPLVGGGFGAAMVVSRPQHEDNNLVFSDVVIFGMRRRYERWPTLEEVRTLRAADAALIACTSLICVRDGRWRVLGDHPGFSQDDWVLPRPWRPEYVDRRFINVVVGKGKSLQVRLDPDVIALDPNAGQWYGTHTPYLLIELDIRRVLDGTLVHVQSEKSGREVITPERLAAWKTINTAIERALSPERR